MLLIQICPWDIQSYPLNCINDKSSISDNQLSWRHILHLKFNEDMSSTNASSSLIFLLIDCMLELRILQCLLLLLATE